MECEDPDAESVKVCENAAHGSAWAVKWRDCRRRRVGDSRRWLCGDGVRDHGRSHLGCGGYLDVHGAGLQCHPHAGPGLHVEDRTSRLFGWSEFPCYVPRCVNDGFEVPLLGSRGGDVVCLCCSCLCRRGSSTRGGVVQCGLRLRCLRGWA